MGEDDSSNQEIHIHITDDLFPVPTILHPGIHNLPNPRNDLESRLDVSQVRVGLEILKALRDALALLGQERRTTQQEQWHQHDTKSGCILWQLVQVVQPIVDNLCDFITRSRGPDRPVQVYPG